MKLKYRVAPIMGPCACGCGTETVRVDSQRRPRRFAKGHGHLTHGASKTNVYAAWNQMVQRCTDPDHRSYRFYGGRGITVCERWRKFELFIADMGPRPKGMTIERKDNGKGYGPDNCKWADMREQSNNRRSNRRLTLNGETRTVAEWQRISGMSDRLIYARLDRGWSEREAIEIPVRKIGGFKA